MPKYRNLSIQLHSDTTDGIPEYSATGEKLPAELTSSSVILELAPPSQARHSPTKCLTPLLQDDDKAQISVYVPIIPKALFWISYRIEAPPVDNTFFVFKLFVNREHVVTWSCDAKNKWKGKTMFGLFDTSGENDGKFMQKRVFQFGSANDARLVGDLRCDKDEDRFLEVRVFRANARKRIAPNIPTTVPNVGPGMQLVNGGQRAPQRYYRFGLIDPIDTPHATFRFYYRTWAEIDQLGLCMGQVDNESARTSLFAESTELHENETSVPVQQAISSMNRARTSTPPSLRNSGSNASISGDYFRHGSPLHHPQHVVYAAQPYPPGASFLNQRAQPHARQMHAPLPMFYAPSRIMPPPLSPYPQHVRPQPGLVYKGHHYGPYAKLNNKPLPILPRPQHANPPYEPGEDLLSFSMPHDRLAIPPELLFQPLLAKGPLPPSPAKLEARLMEDADKHLEARGTFAEREKAAKKAMEEHGGMASSVALASSSSLETAPSLRGRSPNTLLKKKSDEKGSFGGRLFGRLRSRERENTKTGE